MAESSLLDLIIVRLPGLLPRDRVILRRRFDREEDLAANTKEDFERLLGHKIKGFRNMDRIRMQAERDARAAMARGIGWVSCVSGEYPPLLREIYDPPAVLFFRGRLPDPVKPLAAVVGTRRPSSGAATQAYDICRELGRQGIAVVSGLALGIDAMAHRGNLEGGGATVAVLGSGADEIYPSSNRSLAGRILESGGAILSEYPPGTGPRKWNFPARNRIISALARGTLIVEAPERSGALITARFALEQGRDLWVASSGAAGMTADGSAGRGEFAAGFTIARRAGTIKLAEEGAGIVRSAADILGEWNLETGGGGIGNLTESGVKDAGSVPKNSESENSGGVFGGRALAASLAKSLDIDL
ncbi:MAG: DNA-processing protein DprA [Treponema sp.]|jgi:DNA processing protein|nr:DNA-processing protein DprA [Treponema sp.]